jgi:hypothetical protein
VDAASNGVVASGFASVSACSRAPSQEWEMWLTKY